MGEHRADAGGRDAFDARSGARIAARPGGHLDVYAVDDCAKARIDGMTGLGQIDGDFADDTPGLRAEEQQPIAHQHRLLDVVRDEEYALYWQLSRPPQVEKIIAQRFRGEHVER